MKTTRLFALTAHFPQILASAALLAACGGHHATPAAPAVEPPVTEPPAEPAEHPAPPAAHTGITYPAARRDASVIDDYHGTKVADPYRWLEDPDTDESRAWIDAEDKLTFGWLEQVPVRSRIHDRLTKLFDFERYGVPYQRGGRTFFTHNDGLQNQSVLFVAASADAAPRVLLDPNILSTDGTVALSNTSVSHDGKLLAYGLASAGSDWEEWHVRDVDSGKDTSDVLKWIKWGDAAWTHDGKGFYYPRYDEPKGDALREANYYQKLYYHRLGTPQSDDALVYERKDQKEWGFSPAITDDGRYLVINVWNGTDPKNGVFYLDLKKKGAEIVELLHAFDATYDFIGNDGARFFVHTNLDAPRGRLVAIDSKKPDRKAWKELIPQGEDTMDALRFVADRFIVLTTHDAWSKVKVYGMNGKWQRDVELPGIGAAVGFSGQRGDKVTYYGYTSFNTPLTVYRYEPATGASKVFRQPALAFKPDDFVTEQVFYQSKDGTRVPMFLTHKNGLEPSPDNPMLLYGYGGFNITLTPWFDPMVIAWLEMGGTYAVANIRGGNEYGEDWHLAGTKAKKQNVFDDFIAAAEWLIANKRTSTKKLAINGASNGGLLMGACLTQRPDLYGAVLADVGVMDMLRFHKWTIGWAWVSDFGSSDNADEFKALYAYSPLHNIKAGTKYPPTFITTGDHDDRVVPAHSFKFAATLQAAQAGDAPVLIRIETRAGHGGGKPVSKKIDEAADKLAFAVKELGIELP